MSNRGRHKKSNQHLIIQILGKTIANKMMEYQKNWDNQPNLDVFLIHTDAWPAVGGFSWDKTPEGFSYWSNISNTIRNNPLYEKYKNDRS